MAANPLLGATDVARVLKESASGEGTWTQELGFGVIDVAAAVALATGATAESSRAGLRLSVRVVKHRATLTATLSSLLTAVSSAGRPVAFERQVRGKWKRFSTVPTDAAGRAQASLAKATPMKLRAHWTGSLELAGAASNTVTLR